jgi:thiamine-phosphate pyrophosphorylase
MKNAPFTEGLYVVSDSVDALRKAVDEGASIVQLRDKNGTVEAVAGKADQILAYKKVRPFIFILNDDPALAVRTGADGVHVGQDTSTVETRKIVGPAMIVGKTTHCIEQARQAVREGADYISVGPVYATPTKPGRPAVGLEYVREAVNERLDIPFVAIGGIDLTNIDDVLGAGAGTVGVVRAYDDAGELLKRIRGRGSED